MSSPIVMVMNAGYGETPRCPEAKFKPGDVVKVRRLKHLRHLPEIAAVFVVVPRNFPAEYALADAKNMPRPLMITRSRNCITYIVGYEDNTTPHLMKESDLKPSDLPPIEVQWASPSNDSNMVG